MSPLLASIGALRSADSCARLSVWHISAYFIGAQSAVQILGLDRAGDTVVLEEFAGVLGKKFKGGGTEYQTIWLQAPSPKASAEMFLDEWQSHLTNRKFSTSVEASTPSTRVIDLTAKLPSLETKPRLYFATPDITYLRAWFDGVYFVANCCSGVRVQPDIQAFQHWLRGAVAPSASCPWEMLLISACGGDACLGFSRFFEELRRFTSVGQS